jgi:hypothetical protein
MANAQHVAMHYYMAIIGGGMLLLSEEDLEQWTGYKYPSHQIKWLRENSVNHRIGADGKPKVAIEHFQEIMGIKTKVEMIRKRTAPNFEVMRKLHA